MNFRCMAAFLAAGLMVAFASDARAQTASPEDTLRQYVADLQKNPSDYALREKIIRQVQTMSPAPAIPEEARRYYIEGNVLLKTAKDQRGYELAVDAYSQCLLIAPWWADAYYNSGVALELAGRFDAAVNALKLYIAVNPGEAESRKAQDKIYEIGAKKKLAAIPREESSHLTPAAREQKKFEDFLRKIDGRRYTYGQASGANTMLVIDVRGKVLVSGWIGDPNYSGTRGYHEESGPNSRIEIKGRETNITASNGVPLTYVISEDGERITSRARFRDGSISEINFLWQR